MKQRLLLALLVLFAAVGMVKATDEVKVVPTGATDVTITFTGGTITIPQLTGVTVNGQKVTIKKSVSTAVTATCSGSTSVTISGQMSKVIIDNNAIAGITFSGEAKVKELTVTSSTLKTLNCSNLGLTGLTLTTPALTSLTLTGNKLTPSATYNAAGRTVTWGTQTLSAAVAVDLNAKGINLTSSDFTGSGKPLEFLEGLSGQWTYASWQKKNESNQTYTATSDVHAIPNVTGAFAFYDNSRYYTDGTYSCKVTRGGVSIVLTDIKIHPAQIVITIPASDQNGWGDEIMGGIKQNGVRISAANCTDDIADHVNTNLDATNTYLKSYTCHQGDKITVVASTNTTNGNNYEFTKFEANDGLVDEAHATGTAVSTFTVKAKCMTNNPATQDPITLKALFKGKDCRISFNEPSVITGSFYITDVNNNNQKIANNAIVEYGHRLRIQATPANNKYYAEYKVADQEPQVANSHNTENSDFKTKSVADVFVDRDRTITVSFLTDDVTNPNNYTIKLQSPSDIANPSITDITDIISEIQVGTPPNATTATLAGLEADKAAKLTPSVKAGTSVPISVTVATGKDYVVKSIQMGTEALNVINNGNDKFTANFIAPEDKNAAFTIVVVKQSLASVYIDGSQVTSGVTFNLPSAQKYTYDKQKHGLKYTTDPSGLSLDILYKSTDLSGNEYYTTDVPVAAGKYNVKISRKADAYKEIPKTEITTASGGEAIIIEPAAIAITTPPTVTAKYDSKTARYTFVLSGGVANALGENVTSKGSFVVLDEATLTDINDPAALGIATPYTDNLVPAGFSDTYQNVAVRFMMKNDANYNPAATRVRVLIGKATDTKYKMVVNSNIVTVNGQPSNINTVQAEIYNGATRVGYGKNTKTEVSLGTGMKVRLRAIVDGYSKVDFIDMDPASAAPTVAATLVEGTTNVFETGDILLNNDYAFSIALSGKLNQVFKVESFKRKEVTYNGEPQIYDPVANNLKIYKNGTNFTYTTLLLTSPIYYKDETGKVVTGGAPIEAGKYDVCIDIPASIVASDPYDAQTLTASQALQILKKVPNVKWPTGVSRIGAGQRLSAAQLFTDGTADIDGTFAWEDGTITPRAGQFYTIKFTPVDTKNYEIVYLYADDQSADKNKYGGLAIAVSSKPIISINTNVLNGKFIVKSGNIEYHSGNEVNDGTTLTITPVANNGFVCKTLIIDEAGTQHSSTGETTFKVNGKSIYVTGEFDLKSTFDPNTQYTVTLPKADAVKGIIINKPGVNAVKKDGSFSFTLGSLAADAKNIVVKVDGTTLAPVDGTYTIAKVGGNKVVTVTLSNPTKIKVSVEKETKNAKGYVMGKVEVEGLAKDSTCYYGDEVTLVAFPESGVTFTGWSGAISGTDKLATFTVKQSMTIKPKFTGVPTGIETIEDTRVYGREGHIFIGCNGEAKVTLISMDGRVQKIEISGDSRIETAAGVYGVIVEKGSEVLKEKVIVR